MIHIAIGTKAQFIKMAPVMQRLQAEKIEFNLIDLGQHSLITRDLREEFNLKEPDVYLSQGENVSRLSKGLMWLIKLILRGLNDEWLRKKVFLNRKGICLIHGDTVSTLLALYLARRAGIKVAHIEAGLRSYNYFEPFPEEILRVISMRLSDILFAPSAWALENLKRMGLEKKSILISGNTSYESTLYSLNKKVDLDLNLEEFVLMAVHRIENIFLRRRLEFIINLVSKISNNFPIIFVQHPPTINQLKRFKLQEELNKIKNIYFLKILSHAHFIHLVNSCKFVITDGGSIQEESFYLNKPCLLLRSFTERREGIEENVVLSKFSLKMIIYFLDNYEKFKRCTPLNIHVEPSEEIIDYLSNYIE